MQEEELRLKQDEMSSENLVGNGKLGDSIGALLMKRFNIYKRDKCGLVCEVLVPVILVFMGLALLQIGWLSDSPAYVLDTSAYPGPQRLLFNEANVVPSTSEFTPRNLGEQLPGGSAYWSPTYEPTNYNYTQFYGAVA